MSRLGYFTAGILLALLDYFILDNIDIGYFWSWVVAVIGLISVACFWFAGWGYEYE